MRLEDFVNSDTFNRIMGEEPEVDHARALELAQHQQAYSTLARAYIELHGLVFGRQPTNGR